MPNPLRFPGRLVPAVLLVATAVLTLPSAGEAQAAPPKIGVVNLDYIAAQSPAGKALQAKLQTFEQQVRAELEQKSKAASDLRRQIAEGVNTLSEARLNELQKQFEDANIAMRRFQGDKEREGQKMQQEGLSEIERELEPVFVAVRDEGGYDLILNNAPGVVVMVGDRLDITQEVLDRLRTASASGN